MPITSSAKEAIRNSARKRVVNDRRRRTLKDAVREVKSVKTQDALNAAYAAIDKAVKRGVIKANNGARKKSQVAKAMTAKAPAKKK
ncbi:MAG: 30S ribosomal protein S20 [Minisyncoccia bacterium]